MPEEKPWEPQWKRVQKLGAGGQGHTFLARRQDGAEGVLKVLLPHKVSDPKARRRMHQEVTNLQLLSNAGGKVPKVLDSNTEYYENPSLPLFFVMEQIPGASLARCVDERKGLPVAASVGIALDLCRTLQIAVKEGISHRDIKPENIIVRDLESHDVVMVDFGLSFNLSDVQDLTETNEALDNQFISLPERRGPDENKRDPRSDITGVCAILHFCLTACRPRNLRDSKNRPPHRLDNYSLDKIHDLGQRRLLISLFDRAFQLEIAYRFQTVAELQTRLLEIVSSPAAIVDEDLEVILRRESDALLKNNRQSQLAEYTRQSQRLISQLVTAFNKLHGKVAAVGKFQIAADRSQTSDQPETQGTPMPVEFGAWVSVEAHTLRYIIAYKIWAEGAECVVYRHVAVTHDLRDFQTVQAWTPVYRFVGMEGPADGIIAQDLERSVARAVREMSEQIQGQT